MKPLLPALFAASILLCPMRLHAAVHGHCAPATVTPVPGDPGAFRIETAHGTTIARRQTLSAPAAANAAVAVFRVYPVRFDADGDTLGTEHDTILVAPGTIVRWVRAAPGFHTVTNGADSGDPLAATEYSLIFDDATASVELTFTQPGRHDFFCFIHEPNMEGSIIVTSATADVSPPGVIRKPMFSRPPAPNPTRGAVSFAVALPHAARVRITAHDVTGRTVATITDQALPAGEHPFQWDGRGGDGRMLQSGRYFVRLAAGGTVETRAVSLIH